MKNIKPKTVELLRQFAERVQAALKATIPYAEYATNEDADGYMRTQRALDHRDDIDRIFRLTLSLHNAVNDYRDGLYED